MTLRLMLQRDACRIAGIVAAFGIVLLLAPGIRAAENGQDLFTPVVKKLIGDGFDEQWIRTLYNRPEVKFNPEGVSVFFVYRESKLNYDQFAEPRYIEKTRKYLLREKSAFDAAQSTYGVDKEVIAAILLVETKLGDYTGNLSTLNTLSTMASLAEPAARKALWAEITKDRKMSLKKFEIKASRKAKWAYGELKALLTYAQRENMDPADLRGSIAGALGIAQFMPSSILRHAKDGNGDGRIDLFDPPDAIASVAGYLKASGWPEDGSRKEAYRAVWHYNRSKYYVKTVLKIADLLKEYQS